MKTQPEEYVATKIESIVQIAMREGAEHPDLVLGGLFGTSDNRAQLWNMMVARVPMLADLSKCVGCDRSMKITYYEADLLDALLILAMAREVRKAQDEGLPFTEANKVHLPTLNVSEGIRKRQTKCDYLCFIKQRPNWRGSGYWSLTTWGWRALRGEGVPSWAKYWNGHLLGRSNTSVILSQMFKNHTDIVEKAIAKRKSIAVDYRSNYQDYQASEWGSISEEGIKFDEENYE